MQLRRDFLRSLEAGIIGIFLVQGVRYLYATLYAHLSSADLVNRVDASSVAGLPGVVDPTEVQREVLAVLAIFLAPLLGLLIYRTRWSLPLAVALVAVGRYLTVALSSHQAVLAGAVVVAAALLYMTVLAIRRPTYFPVMLTAAFAGDALIRALNATADPSFDPDYRFVLLGSLELSISSALLGLAVFLLLLTAITTWVEREEERLPGFEAPRRGVLTGWGALALGGVLFLEFTLLGLPNAAAHWAGVDYYLALPVMLTATTLTLVPEVRAQAGNFLSMFDGRYRGWLWALLLVLLLVLGDRLEGLPALLTLAGAQFLTMLTLWWMVRPLDGPMLVNPSPILVLVGVVVLILLSIGDYFTYDYAYVRDITPPFTLVAELLRGMRNMGLGLVVAAGVLACLPMILEKQTLPWRPARILETFYTLALVLFTTIGATRAAVPAAVRLPADPNCLRVASFNLHGGYSTFFGNNLEAAAEAIRVSGADIVLLQEVETGRLSSGSIDQVLWLGEALQMYTSFYPQNESLQGLAVLSRLRPASAGGYHLSSPGPQAAVQHSTYNLDEAGPLHIYNVWLSYPIQSRDGIPLAEQQQDQVIQMNELYNLVASNHFSASDSPTDRVILGGSFNLDESSPQYERWAETVFEDPFDTLFTESRQTIRFLDGQVKRWDYLWTLNLPSGGSIVDRNDNISNRRLLVAAVGRNPNEGCS